MSNNTNGVAYVPTELQLNRNTFSKTYITAPGRYTSFQSAIPLHSINGETHEWE